MGKYPNKKTLDRESIGIIKNGIDIFTMLFLRALSDENLYAYATINKRAEHIVEYAIPIAPNFFTKKMDNNKLIIPSIRG